MENVIFIEAKKEDTSECNFLKTVLAKYFADKPVRFVCMDGVGNLFNEVNLNKMHQTMDEGDNILVLLDADTLPKGYGFAKRKAEVEKLMQQNGLSFTFFLYPNNGDDGDVETLMETLACKNLHKEWWDCYGDYERCIDGVKDVVGNKRYNLPNLKAKLHTYISSQQLTGSQRRKLGSGQWLFDDANYWNLTCDSLKPLLDFFNTNLK